MTERTPFRARVHAPGAVLDVQPYDFESPELIGGDDRARLDAGLEAWGRQVGMLITAKTRAVVDVATAPSRVQTFGAAIASADPAGARVLWATASSGAGRVLVRVPLAEARYWAARMLGADGGGETAPLSAVERALARHVVVELLAELQHATGGLFAEPVLEAFGTEPPSTVDRDAQAVVAVVGTLRKGDRGQLAVAIDAELVLQQLGAVAPRQDAAEVTGRITGHLALAPVEVALRFAPTRVGPDTVLDLAEGDLIPLAHLADRPLVMTLDGEPVLLAAVGGNGDRLACVVVDSNGELRVSTSTMRPAVALDEAAIAEALVAALPGPPLMAQPHGSDLVPMQALETGVSATYVGPRSADLSLIMLDRTELIAAGGGDSLVRLGDVLRPTLELATDVIGGGQLGEVADGVPASLFQSADAVVFDLIGEEGVAGWFAVALRTPAPPRAFRDVSSRLGRISTVQMTLAVEIGRATVSVQELLDAQPGTVIELDRAVGSEADVFLNGRMIAHGEIVVVDRRFAVRVTEVLDPQDEA